MPSEEAVDDSDDHDLFFRVQQWHMERGGALVSHNGQVAIRCYPSVCRMCSGSYVAVHGVPRFGRGSNWSEPFSKFFMEYI